MEATCSVNCTSVRQNLPTASQIQVRSLHHGWVCVSFPCSPVTRPGGATDMLVQTSATFTKGRPSDEAKLAVCQEVCAVAKCRSARAALSSTRQARRDRLKRRVASADPNITSSTVQTKAREVAEFVDESVGQTEEPPAARSYDIDVDIFSDDFPYSLAEKKKKSHGKPTPPTEEPTELIFKLDRRGFGWGEEIIPRITVERRPIAKKKCSVRNRSRTPRAWAKDSLECILAEAGVPRDQVESVAAAASAWRVTPGGRPLIDRKRRTRVTRNIRHVIKYLNDVCGIPPGPDGIGAILTQSPQILLANPKQHDRWFRRVVELSAFIHRYDHCNVPENWPESPSLAIWVDRQRAQKAQGTLCEERLQILYAVGFEFGEVAVITKEWELFFDTLVDWLMWHTERKTPQTWNELDWVKMGGLRAGQLAGWVQLQRELLRRELLPSDAKRRLDALGFQWNVPRVHKQTTWMQYFGKLLFAIEKRKMRSKRRQAYSPNDIEIAGDSGKGYLLDVFNEESRKSAAASWSTQEHDRPSFFGRSSTPKGRKEKLPKLDRLAGIRLEVGSGYWLAKQRWLWRRGKLEAGKKALFLSAGVSLNHYSLQEWVGLAQKAANFMNGYEIWVRHSIASESSSEKQSNAKTQRMYVEPGNIKEILSDGGVVEWPDSQKDSNGELGSDGWTVNGIHSRYGRPIAPHQETANNLTSKKTISLRPKIRRWVLTQQALWRENQLSQNQLRHLAFLGLTWILSKDITEMTEASWQSRFRDCIKVAGDLSDLRTLAHVVPRSYEWLMYQRGLRRLGWLSKNRIEMLNELGFDWSFCERSDDDRKWDAMLAELLEFKQDNNHCQVPIETPLGCWLAEQKELMHYSQLSALKTSQLEALGIHK